MALDLVADCGRCAGLCCVALPFAATADFAIDKAAGVPCPNLADDFSCRIHDRLRPEGFPGCIAYDCSGAGQRVTQVVFDGRTWRSDPTIAESMFATFRVVRPVHELLVLLQEAFSNQAWFGPWAKHWQLAMGVFIILVAMYLPQGLAGLMQRFGRKAEAVAAEEDHA